MLEDSGNNHAINGTADDGEPAEESASTPVDQNQSVDGIDVPADPNATSPDDYVESVRDLVATDPTAAGDHVGVLLELARDHDEPIRDKAGEALNAIGLLRPAEFEVWATELVTAAASSNEEVAFLGLRALAQLAATHPPAAAAGLDAAFDHLDVPDTPTRQAALSIIAEVGADDPEAVHRADRYIAAALRDSQPPIRLAGAITAGRLLTADPTGFPRTAPALIQAISDDDAEVREYAHIALAAFAREHPENVPEPAQAVSALVDVSDAELGLREGATAEAASALLDLVITPD